MIKLNKKQMWASLSMIILVTAITVATVTLLNINSASASPSTYLYVDPSEVRGVSAGSSFRVNISVTEAPPTYGWYLYVKWNPNLLNLSKIKDNYHYPPKKVDVLEGAFLDRRYWDPEFEEWIFPYSTSPINDPLSEANVAGAIMIGCTLMGNVSWPSGAGWLCTLNFTVKSTGSSVLDLYKTKLNDHMEAGYPAPTYYPNQDGFFSNVNIHDIAVTSVTANTTSVDPGETVSINVTAENEGDYTETFNVTVYADAFVYNMSVDWWPDEIIVGDEIKIGTQTVTDLATGTNTTLTFTWGTTLVAAEKYYISANATITSLADDDPRDNLLIDGTVTITVPHDINLKIAGVTVFTPEVLRGELANMSVTVLNQGTSSESFTLYVNASNININTTSDSLSAGANRTYNISWDTAGFAGLYTISAYVPPVSGEREVDWADNLFVDGTVRVKVHDLNIAGIKVLTPEVIQGGLANMSVTVLNEGTEREDFWLYVFANRTNPTTPPSSTSGGWTNGACAYADRGTYASITSGAPSASQYYGGYGFNIPNSVTGIQVNVRLDAWTAGNENITLKVSADGGSSWLASKWSQQLTTTETPYFVDVTGWTSWTPAKINNDQIRTQVWAVTNDGASAVYLDWIPINVYWSTKISGSPSSTSPASGNWTSPTNAYADGTAYASITSGAPSASQYYGGYGFNIPTGVLISNVKVRLDAWTPGSSVLLTLLPDSAGDLTTISTVIPSTWAHWNACRWDDTETSYVAEGGTSWKTDLYNLGNTPTTGTINSVTVYMKVKVTATGVASAKTSIKTEGNIYNGTAETLPNTNYNIYSTTYTTNPKTGSPWNWTQVNALQAGVQLIQPKLNRETRATYVWVVVNYTEVNEQIRADVSWDGGTSWSANPAITLNSSETTYWYDVTAVTSWTLEKLNSTNLRTRVVAYTVGAAAEVRLDWIPINVTYTYYTIWSKSYSLDAGASSTYNISWGTTGASRGTYIISAEVSVVLDEEDTADNTRIVCDINGDGKVDDSDLTMMSAAYGSELGDSNWDQKCDLNGDGKVGALDLFKLGKYYGGSVWLIVK